VGDQSILDLDDGITNPEYVLLHAPNTIDESTLGLDTLDLIRKTINEWVKEKQ
jgi:hypothetical protein